MVCNSKINMAQIQSQIISGKGNKGMFIDRFPMIYAAGIRSLQPELRVVDCLKDYMVQDSVIDFKCKRTESPKLKSLQYSTNNDMRNAGPFTEGSQLINPPAMTKFQTLVEDLKCTSYKSYYNKRVGKGADLTSCLPSNLDANSTIFGKKTKSNDDDSLYNIIMPHVGLSKSKHILSSEYSGYQSQSNNCESSYNSNIVNGIKSNADNSGKQVKSCLTEDRIHMGTSLKKPVLLTQRNFQDRNRAKLETCLTPNKNISYVPEGYVFGKPKPEDIQTAAGCLTNCKMNPEREILFKCLAHLNTLRKYLSKRFDASFFRDFYLQLKRLDITRCGWLPKEVVYHACTMKYIRFNSSFMELLLKKWEAVNSSDLQYKTFIDIINFREPLPCLSKVQEIPPDCANFSTTYMEMVKPKQINVTSMAGIPSGRYFDRDEPVTPDGYCKADRSYLPQESDAKCSLCPSIFTLLGISHRDMYTEREEKQVKRVFKQIKKDMDEDTFDAIWEDAKMYHPKGLVCYETFRRSFNEHRIRF